MARKANNTVEDVKHFAGDMGEKLKPAADKVGEVAKQVCAEGGEGRSVKFCCLLKTEKSVPSSFDLALRRAVLRSNIIFRFSSFSSLSLFPYYHRPSTPSSPALRRLASPSAGRPTM